MNRLSPSGIEYLTHVWNFYSGCKNYQNGVCSVGKYCWAKSITRRFKANYANGFEPTFYPEAFLSPLSLQKPAIIGCAFMGDLFGDWVDPQQRFIVRMGEQCTFEFTLRTWIFDTIKRCPQHKFVFLTKCPQNLSKWNPWLDNCWVGATATDTEMFIEACKHLAMVEAKVKYLSLEPLLKWDGFESLIYNLLKHADIKWTILGSRTQLVKHPERTWVEEIIQAADQAKAKVFIKEPLGKHLGINRKEMPGNE